MKSFEETYNFSLIGNATKTLIGWHHHYEFTVTTKRTQAHSHMLRMGDKREIRNKHCARMRAQDGTKKHTLTNTGTLTRAITKLKNVMYTYILMPTHILYLHTYIHTYVFQHTNVHSRYFF